MRDSREGGKGSYKAKKAKGYVRNETWTQIRGLCKLERMGKTRVS
jgi:hypothetical protein